jgi:hypothetical protein
MTQSSRQSCIKAPVASNPLGQISKSAAGLRIIGETLVPDEITALLSCQPSASQVKGQVIQGAKTGRERTCHTGSWHLHTGDCEPENLDGQIADLLGRMSGDLQVWKSLASKFRIDLFCGLIMERENEGLRISPEMLYALGERGILLCLDIYGPDC